MTEKLYIEKGSEMYQEYIRIFTENDNIILLAE